MQTQERSSSCRGVAFDIKPHADPFAIKIPWLGSPKEFPSFIQRSISKSGSHFCDLDLDDEDHEDISLEVVEQGNDVEKQIKQTPLTLLTASIHEQASKPSRKKNSRLSVILLDQGFFTVYKGLFSICLILNITGLVLATTGHFSYGKNRTALFSLANIVALTLCRNEAFLRVVFWLAVKFLGRSWVPLFIKTATTSLLQSLGVIHSSCGVSSIAWLMYALVLTLKDGDNSSPEIIGVASTILGLLCLSSLVWVFIILTISYDPKTKSYKKDISSSLIKRQEFWFTVSITFLIILPWMTVRRVPIKAIAPSGHAAIVKFDGGVKAGILGRISPSPLSEWHAFGIISDGKKEHMILAGAVGDFTKSLVSNPPSLLWVRKVHFVGLPYLVNMYDRVLLVATGSGICVFLSFLLKPCSVDVRGWPKDKVIVHDTAVFGRPNLSQLSINAARNWSTEVVIVTSNPEGSRDIVNACKAAGISAFGPIWDS
ncbi:adenylate-forming reductase 03009-like [Quercus lobata]|uniref:adenylate-forming reductase 03009-like n=1 Tax=Quercus lobata TaxID=97700 RepID=UPI0012471350|nr:adenylate-forming reductase 03009-like [Quercus lobata]